MFSEVFPPNVLTALAICVAAAAATMIGGFSVFAARENNTRMLAFGLSFAAGAMVYISLVEIFGKALVSFGETMPDKQAYSYATGFFFVGVALMAVIDRLVPNPHNDLTVPENTDNKAHLKHIGLLAAIAITVHNLPEGMATFFAALEDPILGSSLAFAIGVHNIPEGISIAIPVYYATNSKKVTLGVCLLSAIAEPAGALIGYFVLASFLSPFVFGGVFGTIAGVMVFLAMDELMPTAKQYGKGHDTVYGIVLGMACIALSLVLFR